MTPLSQARRTVHITQAGLAFAAGVDISTISRAERGHPLSHASAIRITRVLPMLSLEDLTKPSTNSTPTDERTP